MTFAISHQSYGKSRVRVTKVTRHGATHAIVEFSVDVALEGDFEAAYRDQDNRLVIPTDTVKNTIYALARQQELPSCEAFGALLANHFVTRYPHVSGADVEVVERRWERIVIDGQPHPHGFRGTCRERDSCRFQAQRMAGAIQITAASGIAGLSLLKTTASGFANFHHDDYTTLEDTDDRILASTVAAVWHCDPQPADWQTVRAGVRDALTRAFVAEFSPSVQATLYQMGAAVLTAVPEVASVEISMPNEHRLLVDLVPLQLDNPNVIFVPTDEPFGTISATLTRS